MTDTTFRPNGDAPPSGPRGSALGARGGKVGQGWQMIWDGLSHTEYRQGQELAEKAAEALGIKTESLMAQLHRTAQEGILDRETRMVDINMTRGGSTFPAQRRRTFYRIARR